MIKISLTEDQVRSELGKVKLYKFSFKHSMGVNYRNILAKTSGDAKRKLKEHYKITYDLVLEGSEEYVIF